MALKCTQTSSPDSGAIKPKPFSALNHFTVPTVMYLSLPPSSRRYQSTPTTARIRRWVDVLLPTPAPRCEAGWTCGVSQRMLPRSQWREPLRDKVGAEQLQQIPSLHNADRRSRLWSRRAADGQQPVPVTTGECARKPWRIMTADSGIDGR